MNLAPIVLFVYNRPVHTRETVEALKRNELANLSQLIIYSDAPKNSDAVNAVEEVRKYIDQIDGFKEVTVIKREKNWGLANSIIDGVTKVINEYGRVIVLEDDLVTSPYFLNFMNESLELFEDRKDILSVTGFSFTQKFMKFKKSYEEDIYLNIRPMSWSWGTWKSKWSGLDWDIIDYDEFRTDKNRIKEFNKGGTDLFHMLKRQMEGTLDSWYIRWCYNACKKRQFTVYPKISFVNNIGHDGTGVHCGVDKKNIFAHNELNLNRSFSLNRDVKIDSQIVKNFNKGFNIKIKAKILKIIRKFLKV